MLKRFRVAHLLIVCLSMAAINSPALAQQDEPVERIDRKGRDVPNPLAKERFDRRMQAVNELRRKGGLPAEKADTAPLSGSARALVILVEFGGPDTFTYTPGVSRWDPIGKADTSEWTGTVGDCSIINQKNNITSATQFTYNGPLHNQIERPRSADDATGDNVWAQDFNRQYYEALISGNGVRYQFQRQDGSAVDVDLTGKSVKSFYADLSGGAFRLNADVYGWVKVPHSVWWYGADPCPGRRSGSTSQQDDGAIPGAGNEDSLVRDALDALKRAYPAVDWLQYDLDHDGIVDHLWIITAGIDEAHSRTELNRTDYGEAALWAHAGSLGTPYQVYPGISVNPYLMVPEDTGLAVLVHEFAHTLGAIDLYAYEGGDPSVGFWSTMSDTWTGFPLSAVPSAMDPWHLDYWGWLDPLVISDPTKEYVVTLKQASGAPDATPGHKGVKIQLPDGNMPLPVKPFGARNWWSGNQTNMVSQMTLAAPIMLPTSPASTLSFSTAYNTERGYDYFRVQVSTDNGATWTTLTNPHTSGAYGFDGRNPDWPAYTTETFNLTAYAGRQILLRFRHTTDFSICRGGVYVDNIVITAGSTQVFSDNAESGPSRWLYSAPWALNDGTTTFSHAYYLQWRNVASTGGFDSGLGDPQFRYGPANTGLLVWYNNEFYNDNEVSFYMFDPPSFGAKGKMMLVDANPDPYRNKAKVDAGYNNEQANLLSRSLMRDAAFSLLDSVPFKFDGNNYAGKPAVPRFNDGLGYYPGLEYVVQDPTVSNTPKWSTRYWDGSVVLPSTKPYPAKAPGYAGTEEIFWWDAAWSRWTSFGAGNNLGGHGGDGNPMSVGGQYGWHVQIISQSDTNATLRIWNGLYAVNAASFTPNASVAPGSLVAIFGDNLAPSWMPAPDLPLPVSLNGVSVTVNGIPAPIHFVSPGQINIQIPYEVTPGTATITVNNQGVSTQTGRRMVEPTAPGIFLNGDHALAWNHDTSQWNTNTSPAPAGGLIIVFTTGAGAVSPAVPTGAGSPEWPLALPVGRVDATIGGQPVTVEWAGMTPRCAGVMQAHIRIPQNLPPGNYPLVISAAGRASASAVLAVGPALAQ